MMNTYFSPLEESVGLLQHYSFQLIITQILVVQHIFRQNVSALKTDRSSNIVIRFLYLTNKNKTRIHLFLLINVYP